MKDNRENIRLINTQRNELKTDLIINVIVSRVGLFFGHF